MDLEEIKSKVVAFVKEYHEIHGEAPPIQAICEGTGVNRRKLYAAFPGGKRQICEESEIPVPERAARTRKATMRHVERTERPSPEEKGPAPFEFQLTKRQIGRLYGILHLEKRKSIGAIIDALLDMDMELRLKWKMKSVDEIGKAVELARKISQKGIDAKEFVDSYHVFKQVGVPFNSDQLKMQARFLQDLIENGWAPDEIPSYIGALYFCGVGTEISKEDIPQFLDLFEAASKAGKSPGDYARAFYEGKDELKAETVALKAERDRLAKEVADLKHRKEAAAKEVAEYEKGKTRLIREINTLTRQRDARMREEPKSLLSSMELKGGSSRVKAVENPGKPKMKVSDEEFSKWIRREIERIHGLAHPGQKRGTKVKAGPACESLY